MTDRSRHAVDDTVVLRPRTAGGWACIAAALARLFRRLRGTPLGHCVIVDVPDCHYVQFLVRPDGTVWAEAAGDVRRPPGCSEIQRGTLEALGWNASDPDQRIAGGNYWRRWSARADIECATVAVLTLQAFNTSPNALVSVRVFEASA